MSYGDVQSILDLEERKIVALDAMGVVFIDEDDTEELLIPFLKRRSNSLNIERLRDLYYNQASIGAISSRQFFRMLDVQYIEKEYLDECLRIDPAFARVANDLREKYALVMFSNDVSEWSSYLRKKFELDNFFFQFFISGDVGLRKPDPQIYQELLGQLKVHGDECILVDNSLKNLEPASRFGFKTTSKEVSQIIRIRQILS